MKLQINQKFIKANTELKVGNTILSITPPLDEDYWIFRVQLSENQSIVAFPKFFTIGIGFQHEEDWNCNLPYTCNTEEILNHILHNKQDETISDGSCFDAIKIIQETIKQMNLTGELEL